MANPLTEALNAINLKTPYKYDKKAVSAYVLTLFMSEGADTYKIANEINKLQYVLPDEAIFKYYVEEVPKKRRFIKFTKKTKKAADDDKIIKELMETYGISRREAMLSL